MRLIYALVAVTPMILAFAGLVTPAIVLVFAALFGSYAPSDLGVRAPLVAETMPADG